MIYVESLNEYNSFIKSIKNQDILLIPFYSDIHSHYVNTRISFIYIYIKSSDKEYIISFHHNDLISINKTLDDFINLPRIIYVLNLKGFMYFSRRKEMYDVDLFNYFTYNKPLNNVDSDTRAHTFLYRHMSNISNLNDVIPITKHYEKCNIIKNKFKKLDTRLEEPIKDYNKFLIGSLFEIEKNGLFIDSNKFKRYFNGQKQKNNLVYSEYNIFTTTGRPSNRHNGINFAALNKENKSRETFISRFKFNGMLLQFDYTAYHLNLIADLINYTFPDEMNIHEFLGRQYFNTNKLTEEQYSKSKTISFRQLYGGVQPKYNHIEYFQKVSQFIDNVWFTFSQNKYIETPIFNRKWQLSFFSDLNKNKLFNYLLQVTETERNMLVIDKLSKYLTNKETKMILYTYDSILFDYNIKDGKEVILNIKNIMEEGKFPTVLSVGNNYHNIKKTKIPSGK